MTELGKACGMTREEFDARAAAYMRGMKEIGKKRARLRDRFNALNPLREKLRKTEKLIRKSEYTVELESAKLNVDFVRLIAEANPDKWSQQRISNAEGYVRYFENRVQEQEAA